MYIFHSPHTVKNRATVVAKESVDGKTINFSAARCSDNDQFCRSKGVKIASSRLADNVVTHTVSSEDFSIKKFVTLAKLIANYVSTTNKFTI